ncbi:carboxylesterase family protein [Microbacterium sp. MRS-1]|uniref:carboxylesterase family protein n=1 Tax=Microbacterium sp. MRS-1 TaxID=1451261 RepID=UPI002F355D58
MLVWIHGGGFFSGSPASPWYDGRAFARDGAATVTISYRLGVDGFGHIDGAPSNRGVRDWLAALEWVQENIAAFGGDPARVTIAGQSAGGGAVADPPRDAVGATPVPPGVVAVCRSRRCGARARSGSTSPRSPPQPGSPPTATGSRRSPRNA